LILLMDKGFIIEVCVAAVFAAGVDVAEGRGLSQGRDKHIGKLVEARWLDGTEHVLFPLKMADVVDGDMWSILIDTDRRGRRGLERVLVAFGRGGGTESARHRFGGNSAGHGGGGCPLK
jgi:hypothetical protein